MIKRLLFLFLYSLCCQSAVLCCAAVARREKVSPGRAPRFLSKHSWTDREPAAASGAHCPGVAHCTGVAAHLFITILLLICELIGQVLISLQKI